MNKRELIKEVVISLFYLGKYFLDKRKQKKESEKKVDEGHGLG